MNKALTTETQLRIALLGYRSHPHVGGQGIYLHYLSKALADEGHDVHVFSGPPYPELADNVHLHKVPSLDLYAKEKPLRSLNLKNIFSLSDMYEWFSKLTGGFAEPYTFGRRLFRNHVDELTRFDIIHDNQSLCYGLLDLQKANCKLFATIHHPIHRDRLFALENAKDWFHRLLIKRWYHFLNMQTKVTRGLSHLITVSACSKKDIQNYFSVDETRVRIIPNGIDTRIFKPSSALNTNVRRLITTASSDQTLKGLHILIDAFADLRQTHTTLELVVIGKLKQNSIAHQALRKHGLDTGEAVQFMSGIDTAELVEAYNQADIAVCPSLYEGFGIPALEAMACGLPLVSSSGGALPEVIGDAGLLVEPGSATDLSAAINTLIESETLRKALSDKALHRAQQHFSWEKIAKQYLALYRTALAETC